MAESMTMFAMTGDLDGVNSLLYRGFHPDVAVGNVWDGMMTPLCSAAMRGKHRIVLRLLEAGASVNWQDEQGISALDFAWTRGYHGIPSHVLATLDEDGSDLEEANASSN